MVWVWPVIKYHPKCDSISPHDSVGWVNTLYTILNLQAGIRFTLKYGPV